MILAQITEAAEKMDDGTFRARVLVTSLGHRNQDVAEKNALRQLNIIRQAIPEFSSDAGIQDRREDGWAVRVVIWRSNLDTRENAQDMAKSIADRCIEAGAEAVEEEIAN